MVDDTQTETTSIEGTSRSLGTQAHRTAAIEQAFDYRGDVMIHTDGGRVVEGYIFDRRLDVPEPYLRIMCADSDDPISIAYARVTVLEFSGRDTAAGKSWETWVKKYNQMKARGEEARLDPEPLD